MYASCDALGIAVTYGVPGGERMTGAGKERGDLGVITTTVDDGVRRPSTIRVDHYAAPATDSSWPPWLE